VVNVSSRLASLTAVTTPGTPAHAYRGIAYPASKTAVNMITVQYVKAFPNMRINAVEPGFTKTDLNGNTGIQTVEQGAEIIVRMALVGPDGPTGGYVSAVGQVLPTAAAVSDAVPLLDGRSGGLQRLSGVGAFLADQVEHFVQDLDGGDLIEE
jgi:NAD(P)-dependent dehydrogenase (short-subunit alcohol dehydrogenase family)